MNLRALRYFVAIADAGSLTAAAQAISIAQPALTRQLRELEQDLGVQLLQRTPRGVLLTQAGVTLYESAQRMLAEAALVRRQLASQPTVSGASVVLGVSPTLARVVLPGLLENFQRSRVDIQLRAREAFTPALLDWLERGMVDMAVVTNPDPGRMLALHALLGEPFALVSHRSRRIGPIVSIAQLARIPLFMTSLHRGIIERQLRPMRGKLDIQAEIDSVDSIREMVLRGSCATIMPVSVFKDRQSLRELAMSEISGVQLNRLLVLATRIDWRENPALPVVQEMLQAEFARLTRQGVFSLSAEPAAPDAAASDRAAESPKGRRPARARSVID
ncbi:LysR family transcriptional regulator [Bordetella genomosp. 13]|uniref:LysR family transcriptional regulator n=1 Tax=Bordetella genomosp. 13 TaxID=463040 RepID=UPI0018DF7277|nr:LysR family transcriptional regulator [Bordetella genomosp. 13]